MRTVHVPESIAGLVTRRMLVMTFLEGTKITQLAAKGAAMAPSVRRAAARLVLSRVAEAYGRMLLEEGLFQAVRSSVPAKNVNTQSSVRLGLMRLAGACGRKALSQAVAACPRGQARMRGRHVPTQSTRPERPTRRTATRATSLSATTARSACWTSGRPSSWGGRSAWRSRGCWSRWRPPRTRR